MSGNSIAYQLRQNKAIERNLFIDLLGRVGRVRNISGYEYIGFGGPFLEDFKALHASLRIRRMQSIEIDANTHKRQKFNTPFQFVKLHHTTCADFFGQHQFSDKGTIVWLDYTDPKALRSQLDEFRSVVSNANYYDVIKITLNANPAGIQGKVPEGKTHQEFRLEVLNDTVADYLPYGTTEDDLVPKTYPMLLQRCIQQAVAGLSAGATNRYFQILASFVYADGQQMLTVTGIVLDASNKPAIAEFKKLSRLKHWQFSNLEWSDPTPISVPTLSAKERIKLDAFLPTNSKDPVVINRLRNKLGYVPGKETDAAELANYARYYRAYPHFSRVIL